MKLEELNKEINNCARCGLAETRTNVICGEGNPDARLMLIAQAPGVEEDREGKMFVGPSGEVLDELLDRAGVNREEIYLTNLIKCMLPDYRKPREEEIQSCSRWLDQEIEIVDPAILVPLGWYSTRYLFNKYEMEIPADKAEVFATLRWIEINEIKIFPLSHPASVLYNESLTDKVFESYKKLEVLSKQCKWYPICPMKRFWEEGKLDRRWIELYCKGDWKSCVRYQKEEKGEPHTDWMLPNGKKDESLKD